MKHKLVRLAAIFLCAVALTLPVAAHSGRTDSNGGHYNTATGEYHYHHGYSAHQHPNGVCPYSSNDALSNDDAPSSDERSISWKSILITVLLVPTVLYIGWLFCCMLVLGIDDIKKKREKRKRN